MNLVMTLLVKNERDIIETNLDFHLRAGVDHVIVTDNASDDGTRDILEHYGRLPEVTVIDELGNDFSQRRWVTRMARLAVDKLGADWIINSDSDEFWFNSGESLKSALMEARSPLQICCRRNMVYAWNAEDRGPWLERAVYRATPPHPRPHLADPLRDPLPTAYFNLDLPPKAVIGVEGLVSITQGNHLAVFTDPVEPEFSPISVYHYPVRSAEQFEAKIRQGGAAYARNTELPVTAGWHWRRWYRMIKEEGLDAVLSEALPDSSLLEIELQSGEMTRDTTMLELLSSTGRPAS